MLRSIDTTITGPSAEKNLRTKQSKSRTRRGSAFCLSTFKKSCTSDICLPSAFPRSYVRVLRKIFKGRVFPPSLTASALNAHIGHFYASINAPYAHLIHKIAFYKAKNTRKFAYLQFLLYLCSRNVHVRVRLCSVRK